MSLTLPRDAATRRNGRNVFGRGPSGHYFGEISDVMVRGGVGDVGGITPLMKIAHLAEAFGMHIEVHGGGVGNLPVLCSMSAPWLYYERGLLHPFIDYDAAPAWLNEPVDPMDNHGYVHVSQRPRLGLDINFDYIEANAV